MHKVNIYFHIFAIVLESFFTFAKQICNDGEKEKENN
jgi:hypothetical protein